MEQSHSEVSNKEEAPMYSGGWEKAMQEKDVANILGELDASDMNALDYAFNIVDVNALYFSEFMQSASVEDKNAMNIALSELHIADQDGKKIHAETIAALLEKY